MGQPIRLEKITSVRGQSCPAQRNQTFKALIGLLSNMSDDGDYKDPLESNKPGPSKALARLKAPTRPEAPNRSLQAPPLSIFQDPDANQYSQQDLDRII